MKKSETKEAIRDEFFKHIKTPDNIDELYKKSLDKIKPYFDKWCNCENKHKGQKCPKHDNIDM